MTHHRQSVCARGFFSLAATLTAFYGCWAFGADDATKRFAVDDANLALAPYVWKVSGTGPAARAEAAMPGAYVRAVFQGSATVGLVIDGTANKGCPAASMPVVEYSVDQAPFVVVPLTKTGELYVLPLADKLDPAATHRLEVVLSSRRFVTETLDEFASASTDRRAGVGGHGNIVGMPSASQAGNLFRRLDHRRRGRRRAVQVMAIAGSQQRPGVLVPDRLYRVGLRIRPIGLRRTRHCQ